MMAMANDGSNRLFDVGDGSGAEPFEEDGLRQRSDFQSRAPRSGADFKAMAIRRVVEAGGTIERLDFEIDDIPVDALVIGPNGRRFLVLARGTPEEHDRSGVRKTDTLEKAGFRAIMLARCQELPVLLVTSDLPVRDSKPGRYLAKLAGDVFDVISYRADLKGFHRLQRAFTGPADMAPPAAPWRRPLELGQGLDFDAEDDVLETEDVSEVDRRAVNDDRRCPD
jgi:hypothetical protein